MSNSDSPRPTNGTETLFSYVVFHIKAAADESLIALHEFLFPGEAPSPPAETSPDETGGGVWAPGSFKLFISHSSKQAPEVADLKRELREYGVDAFVAHDDIEPTKEWQDVIEVALRTCEALAASQAWLMKLGGSSRRSERSRAVL